MDLESKPTEYYGYKAHDSKTEILGQIDKNPGIRYRELLRLTGLTNGGLEYHLKILERSHKVRVDRHNGRRTRYYPLDISLDESHILGCIRNDVSSQIVFFILGHDLCTFGEIVDHIKKAPSTASWHLKRLSEAGITSINYGTEYQLYSIVNNNFVKKVLCKYKETFRDKIANAYYEIFGEM
ncbi:MAG: winged helix-turn-helix transcriptional regulator [Candidatus Nitrosopolaris sp.]